MQAASHATTTPPALQPGDRWKLSHAAQVKRQLQGDLSRLLQEYVASMEASPDGPDDIWALFEGPQEVLTDFILYAMQATRPG